jgi:hypothetical protein
VRRQNPPEIDIQRAYLEDESLRHRRALAELVKLAPQVGALIKQVGAGL